MQFQSEVSPTPIINPPNSSTTHEATPTPRKYGRGPPESSICYGCHKPGHYVRDCPDKSSPSSKPNIRQTVITTDSEFPCPLPCRCGFGHCFLLTSNTPKNPNRKFYTCPATTGKKCGMFKWCDEVTMDEFKNPPRYRFPECNCGAGTCHLVILTSGINAGRQCFVCSVRKGDGACSFSQLFDAQRDTIVNGQAESNNFSSLLPTLENQSNNDLVEDRDANSKCSKKRDSESPVVDIPQHSPSPVVISGPSKRNKVLFSEGSGHDEKSDMPSPKLHDPLRDGFAANASSTPNSTRDLAISQENICGSSIENTLKASLLTSQAGIRCRQTEFLRQISSAGASSFEDAATLETDGSVIPPCFPLLAAAEKVDTLFPSTRVQDAQIATDVFRDGGIEQANLFIEKVSERLLQTAVSVKNDLLNLLKSMDMHDHEGMLRAANSAFDVLNHLEVDYTTFRERVVEYVACASSLASIEWSTREDLTTQELNDRYDRENDNFNSLSGSHAKAVTAFTASKERLQSLHEEASSLKDKLFQIENQLSSCETETMHLERHLVEISEEVSMSQQSLQATSQEAEKAWKLREQRKVEQRIAKAALEKAKLQLWQ